MNLKTSDERAYLLKNGITHKYLEKEYLNLNGVSVAKVPILKEF